MKKLIVVLFVLVLILSAVPTFAPVCDVSGFPPEMQAAALKACNLWNEPPVINPIDLYIR